MEAISFDLAKSLVSARIAMNEDDEFIEKFISYLDNWERAKNLVVTQSTVIDAVDYIYGEGSMKEIMQNGTCYNKDRKEILGAYSLFMRHLVGCSHRQIAKDVKADYTTIYKNYCWYMVRLYNDTKVRDKHDAIMSYIVQNYKFTI